MSLQIKRKSCLKGLLRVICYVFLLITEINSNNISYTPKINGRCFLSWCVLFQQETVTRSPILRICFIREASNRYEMNQVLNVYI